VALTPSSAEVEERANFTFVVLACLSMFLASSDNFGEDGGGVGGFLIIIIILQGTRSTRKMEKLCSTSNYKVVQI
jgi:hypothetical protein